MTRMIVVGMDVVVVVLIQPRDIDEISKTVMYVKSQWVSHYVPVYMVDGTSYGVISEWVVVVAGGIVMMMMMMMMMIGDANDNDNNTHNFSIIPKRVV